MTPRNIGKQQQISLTFNQGLNPFSWWEMNLNLIGYYVKKDIAFDQYREFNQNTVRIKRLIHHQKTGCFKRKDGPKRLYRLGFG